jgi:carbamoyl-phosphate synthase large subunit
LLGIAEKEFVSSARRWAWSKAWEAVPVSGVENAAYYYSTYNAPDRCRSATGSKVMVLGGGPNRIGQGIEFDYCCVHAAFAIRDAGYESIMVNCNPETVSTDYDTSDKLYFEPLTVEDVLSIYEKEKPEGVIVQFGGQTPLNIAQELAEAGVRILGTAPDTIDLAEDRDRFRQIMEKLNIPQPESGMASTEKEALAVADRIGYPLMVRPSYVLGGRAMDDCSTMKGCCGNTWQQRWMCRPERPILIDRFLQNAIEAEADAIADGTDAFVPAVMEHIELAGIHSGRFGLRDPAGEHSGKHMETIYEYTRKIAMELGVSGPDEHPVCHCRTIPCISWKPIPGHPGPCRWFPKSAISPWPASPPRSCWEETGRISSVEEHDSPFRGQGSGVSV